MAGRSGGGGPGGVAAVAGWWRGVIWVVTGLVVTWDRVWRDSFGVQGDLPLHYHLVRTMARALAEGEWWSPWAGLLNGGRGGDFFRFYPPLFYWVAAGCVIGGMGIIGALKLMTVLVMVASEASVYALARSVLGRVESVVASLLAVSLPGLALIGLNRGFLPQALAAGFVPLMLRGGVEVLRGRRGWRPAAWVVAGSVGVVLTHAITAWMAAVAMMLLMVVWRDDGGGGQAGGEDGQREWWRRRLRLGLIGAGVAVLTAVFWVPQLRELGGVRVGLQVERQPYAGYLLFAPAADGTVYREAWAGLNDVASVVILVQSGLVVLLWLMWRGGSGEQAGRGMMRMAVVVALFGLLIALPWSGPLWRTIPGMAMLQFPWRWQPLVSMMGSIAVVMAWRERRSRARWAGVAAAGALLLLASGFFLTFALARAYESDARGREMELLTGSGAAPRLGYDEAMRLQDSGSPEFLRYAANQVYFRPLTAETDFHPPAEAVGGLSIIEGEGEVGTERLEMGHRQFRVLSRTAVKARLETYATPRWRVTLDGVAIPITPEAGSGLMLVDLPPGEHRLRFDYRRWPMSGD